MVDFRSPDAQPPKSPPGPSDDLYAQLFGVTQQTAAPSPPLRESPAAPVISIPPVVVKQRPALPAVPSAPVAPTSLADCGLSLLQVCDLILKQLYLGSNLLGVEMARQARLPFPVVDEALQFLKDDKCVEVTAGEIIGRVSYRFSLTDLGRIRAREAFEQCRYVGPAPVPLEGYIQQCLKQTVTGAHCSLENLRQAFADLIIRPNLLEELGPAVCSGRSIFIYGPPGNGKTMIAKGLGNFLNQFGGEMYVPYAILADNSIITVFDPTVHTVTDQEEPRELETGAGKLAASQIERMKQAQPDLRWRKVKRPVIITGGELTLDMLDLRYNATSNFYQAPLHIKANGGVFLIDDFGRQIVSPRDLLNRWIIPLEERVDSLTLATGRNFQVPFEQLIIFSTNLDPRELVDEAFLRRIRHKILIDSPDRVLFTEIFALSCRLRNLMFCQDAVDYLYRAHYDAGRTPRASDPRDLLEIVVSICRFRGMEPQLNEALIAEAALRFFAKL